MAVTKRNTTFRIIFLKKAAQDGIWVGSNDLYDF